MDGLGDAGEGWNIIRNDDDDDGYPLDLKYLFALLCGGA